MHKKEEKKALDLDAVRTTIDELDSNIQELISERARLAQEVGKAKTGAARAADYYRPEREAQVLRNALLRNKGPLSDEEIVRLFREIMSSCLAQQEPLKIGYLGPEGTFTQSAVSKFFGHSVRSMPLQSIDEVFQEVESGVAYFGIVPVENSTEGTVNHTVDRFLISPLKICGEVELRVEQHIMGKISGLGDIKRICAHAQALAQCRGWLSEYLPEVERVAVSSNAEGARRARDELGTAAIAGSTAADLYDLKVLVANIEDKPDNTTRFLVIGTELLAPSGTDKTSILVSAADTDSPGALYRLLEPLARHEISMTRIESRPSRRKKWHYVFFMDLEGHVGDPRLGTALAELEKQASLFRVLGSYPKAVM
ncbi:MAG: prephenate dehydratase [Gammaproteobacteria bacterium]|nr:prephenate dehydratase [Gammaproteobacteria bacterium]